MALGEFDAYHAACKEACKRRLLTADQWARLRALWQAAEDAHDPQALEAAIKSARDIEGFVIPPMPPRPPAWELIELELGPRGSS